MSRSSLAALVLIICALAVPSAASAATFCVYAPDGCQGTAKPTIQAALDAAAGVAGRDRVEVGWPPSATVDEGFTIASGNAVDVVGPYDAYINVTTGHEVVVAEPSAVVSGISLSGHDAAGPLLDLQAGTWEHSLLDWRGVGTGVRLGDATLRDVDSLAWFADLSVDAVGPGGLIEDSGLRGEDVLRAHADGLVLRRTEVRGVDVPATKTAARVTGGSLTADDSTFIVPFAHAGDSALVVEPGAGSASVTLRSVTIRGTQGSSTSGLRAHCDGGTADVSATDTVIAGFALDLERSGGGCAVHLDHVLYGTRDAFGGVFDDQVAVLAGPAEPLTPLGQPGGGSPVTDAGSARPADAGETDIDGRPRIADGDGDGTATRDIGAFEYQRVAPTASIDGPDTGPVGCCFAYTAVASDPDEGDLLSYRWTVDGAPIADGQTSFWRPFATAGTHTVVLTVTDSAGLTTTATKLVTVTEQSGATSPETTPAPALGPAPSAPPAGPALQPPVGSAPQPPATLPELLFAGGRIRLARRGLPIVVRCTRRDQPCTGALEVRIFRLHSRGSLVGRRPRFSVPAESSATVYVPVSSRLRRQLRRLPAVDLEVRALNGRRTWALGAVTLRR